MPKAKTNLIIDGIMFLVMMSLAGTGYVRKYILLSGSASRQLYGTKVHMYLWGINRGDHSSILRLFTAGIIIGTYHTSLETSNVNL